MKKGILYSSLIGFGLVLSVVVLKKNGEKEYYTPRQSEVASDGIHGAAAWLHKIRANQVTGEIDPEDVRAARLELEENMSKNRKSSAALNLNWENMGPINVGGRTRAFLIDKNNPEIMYAGAVSGGLFKSTNAGSSWAPVNDQQENLAVVSIAQASNGEIYYGTGENQYYGASGTGTGGIAGFGIFKSTDGGASFQHLPSTDPSLGQEWIAVGKLEVHPTRPTEVYAATNRGLKMSTDGGASWSVPNGVPSIGSATDMVIDDIGQVWVKQGSSIYKSDGLDPPTFVEITKSSPSGGELPRLNGRSRVAVAPSDRNYVYVISTTQGGWTQPGGDFDKAYKSEDGGQTWQVIGERNMYLNPHNGGSQGQGEFDNAVSVDPNNKDRILVGGVTFWEWTKSNGWQLAATTARGAGNYYVHADMHHVVWHPTKANHVFALNDGGVFRSTNNGATWSPISKGYVSAQYYSIGVGYNGEILGGTQDNGTIFIDPNGYYGKSGERTTFIEFNGSLVDGDGGFAEISKLDQEIMFKEMQYGRMGRSIDGGGSFESIYDFDRMDPNNESMTPNFSGFVTPYILWEKLDDPTSTDSLTFAADSLRNSYGFGQGDSVFTGTFVSPSFNKTTVNGDVINTVANLLFDGFTLTAGNKLVTLDPSDTSLVSSNATLDSTYVRVYNDTANNNLPTMDYAVKFDQPIGNDKVTAKVPISYDPGDKIIIKSRTDDIDIIHELVNGANSVTNPKVRVQDNVQSALFVGLRTRSLSGPNDAGGIWMTREALTNKTSTPEWWHIGTLSMGETPQSMAASGDGDILWVGTSQGRVYRFSNLSNARDSASADIDEGAGPSTSVVVKTVVQSFSGRAVTSIATHPFDNDKLVVTLGNYGNSNHVYYSANATAPNPTLLQKDQNLASIPVYASTFNFNDPNGTQVLIGTDYGVFTTDDISAGNVTWTEENVGMARVPVFDLVQQLTVRYDLKPVGTHGYYEGAVYAGTHGRGIFKTSDFGVVTDYIGAEEHDLDDANVVEILNVFPNPATDHINVELSLEGRTDVAISIRNISGQLMKNVKYNNLSKDVETLEIGVNNLAKGTYVITMQKGEEVISGKFIKQ